MTTTLLQDRYETFRLTINRGRKAKLRTETLKGQKYIVAPSSIMAEGVLNGSDGPIFYPDFEISKPAHVSNWNHRTLVNYHPTLNQQPISATAPDVLEKSSLGITLNSSKDKKLRTEAWFEDDRIDNVNPELRPALKNGLPIEVSTGVYMDLELKEGEHNGVKYKGIAHNLRADHLAVLLGLTGAYSVSMGGGIFAANAQLLVANAISYTDVSTELMDSLRMKYASPGKSWYANFVDIGDDYAVYQDMDGKLYKHTYRIGPDDTVVLTGDTTPVKRKISYIANDYKEEEGKCECGEAKKCDKCKKSSLTKPPPTKSPPTGNQKERSMPISKERIDALLALNCGCEEKDRATLEALPEAAFALMETQAKAKTTTTTTNASTATLTSEQLAAAFKSDPNLFTNAFKAANPEAFQELEDVRNARETEKKTLVANILKLPRNRFSEPCLNAKSLGELQSIYELAVPPSQTNPAAPPSYRAAAGGVNNSAPPVQKPMEKLAYNWESPGKPVKAS